MAIMTNAHKAHRWYHGKRMVARSGWSGFRVRYSDSPLLPPPDRVGRAVAKRVKAQE